MASPSLQGILLAIVVATNCIELATSECTLPQTPDHATLVYARPPPRPLPNGFTIRVVCNDLFRREEGDGFMTCRNGRWSDTFTCTAICDPLPSFPRGRITYTVGGTIARYSCSAPGYRLEGIRKRRCMSDGTWSGEPARCRGMPRCEPPELDENLIQRRFVGRKRENLWIIGTILQYSCQEGFSAVTENYPAIQCTRRGWNDTVPICVAGRCPPLLDTIENGNSSATNRTYGPGEAIEFTCDSGYRTTSPSWRVCIVSRGSDGSLQPSWEGVTPECVETQCSRPRRIENGETIVFSTAVNGTTMFRCRSGFELIGEPVIQCQENGQWNATMPVCDNGEYYCPPLAAPLNGYKDGDRYSRYSTVEFSCEPNYALAGSEIRECRNDGQWSGEDTRCVGNLDFHDINQISAVLGQSLDRLAINNLFENEVQQPAANLSQHARFIPTQHEYGVDLYFAFDSSQSVGVDNFERAKRFAKELVKKIGVSRRKNSLRVGALYFSNEAHIAFQTVAYRTTEEVIEEGISKIPYIGQGTNIAEALRTVRQVMVTLSENREGSYRTVFLITDGEANEGGTPDDEADLLKAEGLTIHCLGISEAASRRQLYRLGSRPHNEHVFFLKTYTSLIGMVAKVVNETVDYSECGVSQNTVSRGRVIGGNDANAGAWPWQILLEMISGTSVRRCGGVLIDRIWVLTAAHCLQSADFSMTVVLGTTDLSKPRQQEINVVESIPHPGWDPNTYQNDIALLKLERPAILNANVRLVCLPNKERADKLIPVNPGGRQIAMVTGWGHTKPRGVDGPQEEVQSADVLQQLALPLKSRTDCEESLEGTSEEEYFDESMFCAGYNNALFGACKGDSGGPLVKKAIRQREQRWTLIGLTSWGRGCAVRNELDFFTHVPYFIDWITQKMNPPEEGEGQQDGEDEGEAGGIIAAD